MQNESVPTPPSPERPPLAPYDPPDPAPQAAAWRRAIKVVMRQEAQQKAGMTAGRRDGRISERPHPAYPSHYHA